MKISKPAVSHRRLDIREGRSGEINKQKAKNSADSSQSEHESRFEKLGEQSKNKSLFQLALEVGDLLEEQKLKRNQKGGGVRKRYIE
jgi:hypothetical protein